MGHQRLGPKLTRRIARETGLDIARAWGNGGYWFSFVTTNHRHGWWHKKDGEWEWDPEPVHYTTCPQDRSTPYTGEG
jgi:hypothetical protein